MKHSIHSSRRIRRSFAKSARALIVLGAFGGALACGSESDTTDSGLPKETDEAVGTYATIVHASYADSLQAARHLDSSIQAFLDDPSEETLEAAKAGWLEAREPYLQTEVYRFYDGPIDNPEDGPEGMINAWPLDEAYIDYVVDDPESGIINDPEVEIDRESLVALNEQGGEANIATGFHAIEFLLWGQDLDEDGPGNRPYTDYTQDGDAPHPERRALYLETVSALLVEHLEGLVEAWDEEGDNYREDFEALEPKVALGRILAGMITLSGFETGGERLQAALDTGSQEDEHSCFSDNTHRDMIQDIQGVLNVWKGRFVGSEANIMGTSVEEIVRAMDPDLATEIDEGIAESLDLANELHVPFDREIASDNEAGNERVSALVSSLSDLEHDLQAFNDQLFPEAADME